jgi:hypothetical protein
MFALLSLPAYKTVLFSRPKPLSLRAGRYAHDTPAKGLPAGHRAATITQACALDRPDGLFGRRSQQFHCLKSVFILARYGEKSKFCLSIRGLIFTHLESRHTAAEPRRTSFRYRPPIQIFGNRRYPRPYRAAENHEHLAGVFGRPARQAAAQTPHRGYAVKWPSVCTSSRQVRNASALHPDDLIAELRPETSGMMPAPSPVADAAPVGPRLTRRSSVHGDDFDIRVFRFVVLHRPVTVPRRTTHATKNFTWAPVTSRSRGGRPSCARRGLAGVGEMAGKSARPESPWQARRPVDGALHARTPSVSTNSRRRPSAD